MAVLEEFGRAALANALAVSLAAVGKRTLRFKPYRSKSFDVCWPLTGEPRILISVKSMQNAYRNFTNRIEEAFGDAAVLRVYEKPACFGFFYVMVDGEVARGRAESVKPPPRVDNQGRTKQTKGANVHLSLIEQGGDFFDISDVQRYRGPLAPAESVGNRKDVVVAAQQTLLDLLSKEPSATPTVHYDAMAFAPIQIRRVASRNTPEDWDIQPSSVDPRLSIDVFFSRLVETAKLRGFV